MSDIEKTQTKFESFLECIRNGKIVPLVGAGVSKPTHQTNDTTKQRLTGWEIANILEAFLLKKFELISRDSIIENEVLCEVIATVQSRDNPGMAKLAEILGWIVSHKEICEKLSIEDWDDTPTRAHRYIVRLALDNAITEVISTNYDCCFEKAWKEEFGSDINLCTISSSSDLGNFCNNGNNPYLNLYKINGCANIYKENKENYAESIILTDTQLQGYCKPTERKWIKDFLRDRARCKQLILSGFGSDEPQIWYVLGSILEEIKSLSQAQSKDNVSVLWVALYGTVLPFHILKTIIAELELINGKQFLIEKPQPLRKVFTGKDSLFFNSTPGKLDAGDFWFKVWLESLKMKLKSGGLVADTFFRWVTHRTPRQSILDKYLLQIWDRIVESVFDTIPFSEYTAEGDKLSKAGMEIAEPKNLYIRPDKETSYWVNLILTYAVLANEIAKKEATVLQEWLQHEPVVVIRIKQCCFTVYCGSDYSIETRRITDDTKNIVKWIPINMQNVFNLMNLKTLDAEDIVQNVKKWLLSHTIHASRLTDETRQSSIKTILRTVQNE